MTDRAARRNWATIAIVSILTVAMMAIPTASPGGAQSPDALFERIALDGLRREQQVVIHEKTILVYSGTQVQIHWPTDDGGYDNTTFGSAHGPTTAAAYWDGGFVFPPVEEPVTGTDAFLQHYVQSDGGGYLRQFIAVDEVEGLAESGLRPRFGALAVWGEDLAVLDWFTSTIHIVTKDGAGYRMAERIDLKEIVTTIGENRLFSIDATSDTLVVGWYEWVTTERPEANKTWGRAIVLQRGADGSLTTTILRDLAAEPDEVSVRNGFGYDVAVDGTTVVVSNPQADEGFTGNVHVYEFSSPGVYDETVLRAAGARIRDRTGVSVAIDGRYIAASTFGGASESLGLPPRPGELAMFERIGPGNYRELILTDSTPQDHDWFGHFVDGGDGVFVTGYNVVPRPGDFDFWNLVLLHRGQCRDDFITVDLGAGDLPTNQRDVIKGTDGDDTIAAGAGDDVVCAGAGDDVVFGQSGADIIYGDAGEDRLRGGDGDDTLLGGEGVDDVAGGRGNDTVQGQGGADIAVRGGTGDDIVGGGGEDDRLVAGNGGQDSVSGGPGNDKVTGGPRPDELSGGFGDDEIRGNGGGDTLLGNAGDDDLYGGPGGDALDGGDGDDTCNGGTTPGVDATEFDTVIRCEEAIRIP